MENYMQELLAHLRAMQLYYHNCHNVTVGVSFVGDHALFAEFYAQLEADYDLVAERLIGLKGRQSVSLKVIVERVEDILEGVIEPNENAPEAMFAQGGLKEQNIKDLCDRVSNSPEASVGVQNLMGTICENVETRLYKIMQRIS